MLSTGTIVKVIGQKEVEAKLLAAAPRIMEQNALMVTAMLNEIKPIVEAATPLGPGHFGYHARDRYRISITTRGIQTLGQLWGVSQAYWREFGTRGRFRGPKIAAMRGYLQKVGGKAAVADVFGTGGEPALMIAHKAAAGIKKFIATYYGMAGWWRA